MSWDVDDNGQPDPLKRITFNIPMRDVDEVNGSTEIWLGSHNTLSWVPGQQTKQGNTNPGQPDAETREMMRPHLPPTQAFIPQGGVLLRDSRGWHRGVPNRSDRPRHMLVASYVSQTVPFAVNTTGSGASMRYSESCRGAFSRAR